MTKNLKILAIIFSVVLNIVFIGSYFYRQSALFTLVGHGANPESLLYEELNLSREQLERFGPLRDRFHAFVNEQGKKIKARQLELIDLLAGERPDRRAIAAKRKEIQTLQRRMQSRVIDHLLEESGVFTPEQRRKFFALIKERIGKRSGPRPRWMPQTGARPSEGVRP